MSSTFLVRHQHVASDAAPFSWFVGLVGAVGVYYLISERDIRQVELRRHVKVSTRA